MTPSEIAAAAATPKQTASGSHSGAKTQSQDQVITLVSLRTMNTIVSRPQKLMPPDDCDCDILFISFLYIVKVIRAA